jgi:cystathionine gamma-synthase
MRFETMAVHAAAEIDPRTGAVTPPIHPSTTFERAPDGTFPAGFSYIRERNPNRSSLETALALLEGADEAIAFSSGMAAVAAIFQSLAPGDHVVAPEVAYYGTPKILKEQFVPWGLEASFVDMSNPAAVRAAVRGNTKLVWTETPSNPLISITDLAEVAAIAMEAGAMSVCDNTWATPYLQRPLERGIDLVMHSTTKYLAGHSDAMGGAVLGRAGNPLLARVRQVQIHLGAVPSPFDSWLVLRGIRTLPWRMRAHCDSALAVASALALNPKIVRVHYPGLPSDPGHAAAARQMSRFGGMVSIVVPGEREGAFAVANRLRLFTRATSLGGPEILVEHRASVEGPQTRAPEGLLRLSIGLEHPDDLIADLEQALE